MNKNIRKTVLNLIQLIAGTAMSCTAMACFALPYNMVVAGVTGIGRTVHCIFGTEITVVVYAVNIILFLIGAAVLGRKFAATIVVGSFAYPLLLDLFGSIGSMQHLVNDPLLAAVCAGILDGAGIGLVIRMGGSTGGIDIPPLILNRKFGWKIPTMIAAIDIVIFLLQLPFTTSNGVILGILYALIYSVVMDRVLIAGQGGMQLMIFSRKSSEISEALLRSGFGVTILEGKGGYLHDRMDAVYSVVSNRALNTAKKLIREIDEAAFITVTSVNEIRGNGFTQMFRDEEYVRDIEMRSPGER